MDGYDSEPGPVWRHTTYFQFYDFVAKDFRPLC